MQETAREVPRGNVKLRISELAFSEIHNQSRLFLDYLAEPTPLKRFYPNAPSSIDDIESYTRSLRAFEYADRNLVCDALLEINKSADASEEAFENIKQLRSMDAVAVLTGQQTGLFGGPLYTIYKAMSAIRMAKDLRSRGVNAIPIFWAAAEDHDFAEVAAAFLPTRVEYAQSVSSVGRPVGNVHLGNGIEQTIEDAFSSLPHTEFTDELRRCVADCYQTGAGFSDAFIRLMARLFGRTGLLFCDPTHVGLRQAASPIVRTLIDNAGEVGDALLERDKELQVAGYSPQVVIEPDHVPLFWIDGEGKRLALRRAEGGFRVKGDRRVFSKEELLEVVETTPEKFSPAVMFRPVVQDFLFPTACYFGGGAEVSYFAQNSVVYKALGRPVTPVLHRQSYTLVEPRQRRSLSTYGLSLSDLFAGREKIDIQIAEKLDEGGIATKFDEVEKRLDDDMRVLKTRLQSLDPTIAANLDTRSKKIRYQFAALRKKAMHALVRRCGEDERRIEDLFAILLPDGQLQERQLNVLYFLNKYGPHVVKWLLDATDVEVKTHRIIDL